MSIATLAGKVRRIAHVARDLGSIGFDIWHNAQNDQTQREIAALRVARQATVDELVGQMNRTAQLENHLQSIANAVGIPHDSFERADPDTLAEHVADRARLLGANLNIGKHENERLRAVVTEAQRENEELRRRNAELLGEAERLRAELECRDSAEWDRASQR